MAGVEVEPLELPGGTAKYDLTVSLTDEGAGLAGDVEYNLDLFDAATARRIGRHLEILLAGAARHPEARLSDLPLLSQAEQDELLRVWQGPVREPSTAAGPRAGRGGGARASGGPGGGGGRPPAHSTASCTPAATGSPITCARWAWGRTWWWGSAPGGPRSGWWGSSPCSRPAAPMPPSIPPTRRSGWRWRWRTRGSPWC